MFREISAIARILDVVPGNFVTANLTLIDRNTRKSYKPLRNFRPASYSGPNKNGNKSIVARTLRHNAVSSPSFARRRAALLFGNLWEVLVGGVPIMRNGVGDRVGRDDAHDAAQRERQSSDTRAPAENSKLCQPARERSKYARVRHTVRVVRPDQGSAF